MNIVTNGFTFFMEKRRHLQGWPFLWRPKTAGNVLSFKINTLLCEMKWISNLGIPDEIVSKQAAHHGKKVRQKTKGFSFFSE